jgi:hypothetical protein
MKKPYIRFRTTLEHDNISTAFYCGLGIQWYNLHLKDEDKANFWHIILNVLFWEIWFGVS